ncbi:helix-turn-helix domain-containing protein [Kitasatospora sp. NPDC051705]|uniref:helix-turn-helix domain-containing protein n=1 Tax=Kitasatospora sp. NPDC051705 TaxID=3364057 RepID=UPI0037B75A3B
MEMPYEEDTGRAGDGPLAELRRHLADGRALAGLNVTELAARARLGRTTVHEALRVGGPVPTADTVAALARALRLPTRELLDLRRAALREADPGASTAAGTGTGTGTGTPGAGRQGTGGVWVRNELSGTVHGMVIQAGTVHVHPGTGGTTDRDGD